MDDNQQLITEDTTITAFKCLSTWKVAVLQILSLIAYGIIVLILSADYAFDLKHCCVIYITFYCQAGLWIISLIIDHYYKWQHHILYLKGHFEFQKQISKWTSLLFVGLSLFNVVFLLFGGSLFLKIKNQSDFCKPSSSYIPIISLNVIIATEVIVLVSFLVTYSVKVIKFNEEQPVPDVKRVRFWVPENSSSVLEVGYRDKGQDMVDLLQKQADLIQYYKGKIVFLNEKIMKLSHATIEC